MDIYHVTGYINIHTNCAICYTQITNSISLPITYGQLVPNTSFCDVCISKLKEVMNIVDKIKNL